MHLVFVLGRSLHGGVDWNIPINGSKVQRYVAPFTGAWIEIKVQEICDALNIVAPFTGAWIEISYQLLKYQGLDRRSLHGGVDWNNILIRKAI